MKNLHLSINACKKLHPSILCLTVNLCRFRVDRARFSVDSSHSLPDDLRELLWIIEPRPRKIGTFVSSRCLIGWNAMLLLRRAARICHFPSVPDPGSHGGLEVPLALIAEGISITTVLLGRQLLRLHDNTSRWSRYHPGTGKNVP